MFDEKIVKIFEKVYDEISEVDWNKCLTYL
jgi:hypothetical protein